MEESDSTGSEAFHILRPGYYVYTEDSRSGFKWEKMVTQSAMQNKIMDVVIKRT
ncbi:MAG: hypothetical protein QW292_12350 [Candidatus Parvarchaeota archaeon]